MKRVCPCGKFIVMPEDPLPPMEKVCRLCGGDLCEACCLAALAAANDARQLLPEKSYIELKRAYEAKAIQEARDLYRRTAQQIATMSDEEFHAWFWAALRMMPNLDEQACAAIEARLWSAPTPGPGE